MVSTSSVSLALLLSTSSITRLLPSLQTLQLAGITRTTRIDLWFVHLSVKEQAVTGLTAAAMAAVFLAPDIAKAVQPSSLKNFLLSITCGRVMLGAIIGAVAGVSNFDPVKRP